MFDIGLAIHCLWNLQFSKIVQWASFNDLKYLEVSCLPSITQGGEILGNFNNITMRNNVQRIKEIINLYGIEINTLTCNLNNLHENKILRKKHKKYLLNTIVFAHELGVKKISTFIGLNRELDYKDNIKLLCDEMKEITDFAYCYDIKIIFENCPAYSSGILTNLAAITNYWDDIFEVLDTHIFGICLDLSHCIAMGDNYIQIIEKYMNLVLNIHAKDKMCIGQSNDYCLPGEGIIDWSNVIGKLHKMNYKGKIVIENESSDSLNDDKRVFEDIIKTKKYINSLE